jgi:uncharacterized protein YggE
MLFQSIIATRSFAFQVIAISTLLNTIGLSQEVKPTISVTGESEIRLLADEIVIHASIESRAKTPAEACKDNREKSRLLLEFLKSQSIDEKMINADLLSINPILPDPPSSKGSSNQANDDPFGGPTEENPFAPRRRAIGYTAFREFAIVVKDIKKFEDIYQGIVEKGINRVDSVRFRLQAVRVAKERGQAMANELGAELSAIKSIGNSRITSGDGVGGRGMGMGGMGMGGMGYGGGDPFDSSPTSTLDGQITLQSSVDIVFYLGNTEFKK